jgi:selenium donor protein
VAASAEDDLVQMMAGASEALAEAGCALGGGHTSEGAEVGIGFAVTGRAPSASALLHKRGLVSGHALVLTKPIGTGVLFAALMRHAARGSWIKAALASMRLTNGPAAAIVREHGASACTDVTGFGLCGHLLEMCRSSSKSATVHLDRIPLLDGATHALRRARRKRAPRSCLKRAAWVWHGQTFFRADQSDRALLSALDPLPFPPRLCLHHDRACVQVRWSALLPRSSRPLRRRTCACATPSAPSAWPSTRTRSSSTPRPPEASSLPCRRSAPTRA